MRIILIIMALTCCISNTALAQQWQTVFSVDSRLGYSSNTYLNPYSAEWDRSINSGYGVITGMGQTAWYDKKNTFEVTGLAVFEPFLANRNASKGGLGLVNYQRKLSSNISAGIEAGSSYFTSSFTRKLFWAQPTLTWFPTPFTKFKVKAGSNYRIYENYTVDSVSTDTRSRTDLYSLELETWPTFQWRLTAGLYGNLDTMPAIGDGFSSLVTAGYTFGGGTRLTFSIGLEQYQNEQTRTVSGGGGGFPPTGGGTPTRTETIQETNRIYKIGVEGSIPITDQLSAFVNAEGLQFQSSATGQGIKDVQVSGGVRMMIQPFRRSKAGTITPEWESGKERQKIEIQYLKEGQLYLVGDFNNWERPGIPLTNAKKNRYVTELQLEPGAYEYKVLCVKRGEEEWVEFSDDTYTVDDGFGGENALLLVE